MGVAGIAMQGFPRFLSLTRYIRIFTKIFLYLFQDIFVSFTRYVCILGKIRITDRAVND